MRTCAYVDLTQQGKSDHLASRCDGPKKQTGGRRSRGYVRRVPKQECIPMLKALADTTRWRIVRELLAREATVGELVERLDVSQYNVSKHLRILREAGIVEMNRDGQHMRCSVAEDFRKQLTKKETVLDLGCCTFRFD